MLEWVAVVTMLIDHIGYSFFPGEDIFRIIGRIALPLYVFLCTLGIRHTKNKKKYLLRLTVLAVLAQVPFAMVFGWGELNVIFNLLLSASLIMLMEFKNRRYLPVAIILSVASIIPSMVMDYGVYCLALMLIYFYIRNWVVLLNLHVILNFVHFYIFSWDIQLYSIIGTMLIIALPKLPKIQIWRPFYQTFYPVHLFLIGIVKAL